MAASEAAESRASIASTTVLVPYSADYFFFRADD
jgi:hypothetical protein